MSEAILEARGVVKRYGKFTALGGVDLRIMPRTVHSVIGPNGAGKTTLFHTLTGTVPISAGSSCSTVTTCRASPITSACGAASRARSR
jgi:branched-chain amino acid transport system ATP-binding protein